MLRPAPIFPALVAVVASLVLANPAHADWDDAPACIGESKMNVKEKSLVSRKECSSRTRLGRPATKGAPADTVSSYDTRLPEYHRHVSGCYPHELQNMDFGDCQRQQDAFCGEDGTWVQQVRVRRENPTEPIEHGARFCTGTAPAEGAQSRPALTMEDLAAAAPDKVAIHLQNGGRGLRNAHTNIVADAEQILERKTQFGELTLLRLTPVEFRWDYGDGTTRTTTDPGRATAEFNTQTSTSHVYRDTGTYTVNLSTVFIGEVSYDDGETWQLVPGQLVIDSDPAQADIFRSVTRNVAEDCVADPDGWGCGAPGTS